MNETTFWVLNPGTDLYQPALDAITDHYAALTPLDADWAQQPPAVPPVKIVSIELTGNSELDLEDGYPSYEAKVEWEEA